MKALKKKRVKLEVEGKKAEGKEERREVVGNKKQEIIQ